MERFSGWKSLFRVSLTTTCILAVFVVISCNTEDAFLYKDAEAPIEERVEDLLSRMTLEEKFGQLFMVPCDLSEGMDKYKSGIFGLQLNTAASRTQQILEYAEGGEAEQTAKLANTLQKYFVEETRLGIPIIPFDEALHGLVRKGATAFPQAIGLAASWDTTLVKQVAHTIATETKTRGIRQILSPVLNIARDVRWGRTEETYGEDPFLTTQMGISFIAEFEKLGIITTPKHFAVNVGDGGRDSYPIHINERLLEEIYFPAYKAAFQEAHAGSVMTSYNSLNGRPCTANDWLLNQKLKNEWGFDGFAISDANAVGIIHLIHFTTNSYAEAAQQSIEGGLDVIFEVDYDAYKANYYPAFEQGMIDEEKLNEAVRRVLRAKFRLGLFENSYVDVEKAKTSNGTAEHAQLAREASRKAMVLLKNEDNALPLDKKTKSIAVIGVDAVESRLGGYAGPGNAKVSILEGIKNKVGQTTQVSYAPGCGRTTESYVAIPAKQLCHLDGETKKPGLKGEYFNNINLEGEPELTRIDSQIDFRWTLFSPEYQTINYDQYSARWIGKLIAPETGKFNIGLKGDDGYRLYIDGDLIIDNWRKQSFRKETRAFQFQKDKEYDIKVEFYETVGNVWFKLLWDVGVENNAQKAIDNAVRLAQKSESVILVVGIEEGEFRDRSSLSLPGHQEEMIAQVAATGTPTTIALVGGSAVTMNPWMDKVSAIVDIWYPGEQGGNALADVLFGDYNPAGRLPITFPMNEGQLPLVYNHKPTGRGDDYLDGTGKPLFPFGYGLSYSTFEYSNLMFSTEQSNPTEEVTVTFELTNTGVYDGDEVVQLYIRDLVASVTRPVMELKGFQRIHLKQGETKTVSFVISPEQLKLLDENMNHVLEPGAFRIMIGAASNDIRLREILTVQ
ncbi:MAG: glycoside hydrolase family 3 N-terminal domain-containing protein [Bacteroidota bacterium]